MNTEGIPKVITQDETTEAAARSRQSHWSSHIERVEGMEGSGRQRLKGAYLAGNLIREAKTAGLSAKCYRKQL